MEVIEGKLAVVTGAASGIGLAIAKSLARAGARVILADIDRTRLDDACASVSAIGVEAMPLLLDVTSTDSWQNAFRQATAIGRVDILCNNAGVGPARKTIAALEDEDWTFIFGVNALGIAKGIKTFLPAMQDGGHEAHIVNTASILSHFALAGAADYVMSKYAALAISETLRMELIGSRVGVSVLCPGLVDTGLQVNTKALRGGMPEVESATSPVLLQKPQAGIDPAFVGDAVVDAIRQNKFYIFTHPEYERIFDIRASEIKSAMNESRSHGASEDMSYLGKGVLALSSR